MTVKRFVARGTNNARPSRSPRPNTRNSRSEVHAQAIDKLSHVDLSDEQRSLKQDILDFASTHLRKHAQTPAMYVVQGDAGTGKSVVLNSLFNEISRIAADPQKSDYSNTSNFLVVNHPEMLKLYVRMSKQFPYIRRSSLERPTSLINQLQKQKTKADIVIVDEAHLLATSKDAFKRFYGDNHLHELMTLSRVLVLVYDEKQALRMGSYWDENTNNGASLQDYYNLVPETQRRWYTLKQQFRVAAPNDVLNWINDLSTKGKIPLCPKQTSEFDFRIWPDCGAMYEELKAKDKVLGQCRMLATYDFPYRLDGKDYFVTCGENFKLRWDRYTPKAILPWSERVDTIEEVGSVYTIQGFDLNYAGVILGRSVGYDKANDCIKLKPEMYDDHAGFTKKKNIANTNDVKHKIIMNSINVLLTRGVKGLYVYAYDDELRQRLLQTQLT